MYFWKFWRDTRSRFFGYLIVLISMALAAVFFRALEYRGVVAGSVLVRGGTPERVQAIWQGTIAGFAASSMMVLFFGGLALGSLGVGDEFRQGSLEFLLTQPRRRRYFIWSGWAIGALEQLALIFVTILATVLSLMYVTKSMHSWRIWILVLPMLVISLVLYGLTYLLTVVRRNGNDGLTLAFVTVLLYLGVASTAYRFWQLKIPLLFGVLIPLIEQTGSVPFGAVVGWTMLALAFPALAQWVFERRDI